MALKWSDEPAGRYQDAEIEEEADMQWRAHPISYYVPEI